MIIRLFLYAIMLFFGYYGISGNLCDNKANQVVEEPLPEELADHFSISFKNMTNQAFSDDQIFLQFFGLDGPALPNRTLVAVTVKLDKKVADGVIAHQVAAEKNAALPAIKLSEIKNKTLYLPQSASALYPEDGRFYGTRIYISLGKPLSTLVVNPTGTGTSQPTFADNDPDVNTIFDWIEFTYDPKNSAHGLNAVTFGGNTTGVDQFAIPLWMQIYSGTETVGDHHSKDGPVGMLLRDNKYSPVCLDSRKEIFNNFLSSVSANFKVLLQGSGPENVPARVLSPVKSAKFMESNPNYFKNYIDQIWDFFRKKPLNFCDVYDPNGKQLPHGSCFTGTVTGDDLVFYRTSGRATGAIPDCTKEKPCKMKKPDSKEVFENGGVFALPDNKNLYPNGVVDYNLFASQFVAAISRHSATNIFESGPLLGYVDWHGKSFPLYSDIPNNEYANYFHRIGIHHRFYGMGYDDVGAPPKDMETKDLRPVGGPLVFANTPGEVLKALIVGIQW